MSKFIAYLTAVGLILCTTTVSLFAQPDFSLVPSNTSPDLGEQFTIDVTVDGFTDIVSFQFTLGWDETLIDYVSIGNFTSLNGWSAASVNPANASSGFMTVSWNDPLLGAQTLSDGTVLFSITYDVIATEGAMTDIGTQSFPIAFEVLSNTGSGLMDITGSASLPSITMTLGDGGSGGPPPVCGGFSGSGLGLHVESDSAATGEQLCLDVTACNFTDLAGVGHTIQFDPNELQFDSTTNYNLQDLDGGAFGTTNAGSGLITFAWFDPMGAGVTVPDETVIYSICFTAIGAGGSVDTVKINDALAAIDINDSGGMSVDLETVDGVATITGTSGSAVTVFASCETGEAGDTVTVEIGARNFTDIVGIQYSMGWDETIIEFLDTEWTGVLPGAPTFNTTDPLVDSGRLVFGWDDPTATGQSVADETIIYRVRFIIVGSASDVSAVEFTDDPAAIEVIQNNGGNQSVPLARIPGKVEVTGAGLLTFTIDDVTGCTGDTVEVCVIADNFNGLALVQYDVTWDDTQLDLIETANYTLDGLTGGSFAPLGADGLRLLWVHPLLEPQVLANGTCMYTMNFEILGADNTSSTVEFDESSTVEFSTGSAQVTDYTLNNGTISVQCSMGALAVSDTTITNVLCNGETNGAIDITVVGGSGSYTYAWSNSAVSEDISGLAAGTYTVTISDGMTSITESYEVTQPAVLSANASSTDVSCNGGNDGTATVNVTGGTTDYTFEWSNTQVTQSINALTAATYTVTVTDANGCTTTASTDVGQPAALVATITSTTDVSCNGASDGAIDLSVTGGTTDYAYDWGGIGNTQDLSGLAGGTYTVTVTDANGCTTTASTDVDEPAALVATISGFSNVSCNGASDGTIDLSVTGGTTDYSYAWSNSAVSQDLNGLGPNTYTVTVTDANGCTTTASQSITEPAVLSIDAVVEDESSLNGQNGSINITVTGGTTNYIYDWGAQGSNEDLTSLPPATYTVTVTDANGCTISASYTVNPFDAPMITVDNVVDVSCNGGNNGAINVSISGGVPNYTYDWDGPGNPPSVEDISGLVAGVYTLTVTDMNGVTAVETVTVDEPTQLVILIDNVTEVTCNGDADGTISVTVTGGTPNYTYNWGGAGANEDLTGLSGGNYTLTVTDANGCTLASNTVTVPEPTALDVTIVDVTEITCNGGSDGAIDIEVSGGTPGYTYAWSNSAVSQDLSGLGAGTYTVTVTDIRGCTVVSNAVSLTAPDAIDIDPSATMVSCNGFSDGTISLNVSGGTPDYSYTWNNGLPDQPNHTGLPAGTYFVTVTDANGCTNTAGPIAVTMPAPLTISSDVTNASVANNDGAINVTVGGGTPNYSYQWSNGFMTEDLSGLSSGVYIVTATDANGCEIIDTSVVLGVLAINGSATPVSCNGLDDGSIDIEVVGGIEPFSYSWSAGVTPSNIEDPTNLFAGTYSVTVTDANGEVADASFTVGTPTPLMISNILVTHEMGLGGNGAIDISVDGGTLPYEYQWSHGPMMQDVFDLDAGSYNVIITDGNGCVFISEEIVVNPAPLTISSHSTVDLECNGESNGQACVNVFGGTTPYTFSIGGGIDNIVSTTGEECFTGLSAGVYNITITDSGTPQLAVVQEVEVSEPDPISILVLSANSNTDPDCDNPNGSINIAVSGGSGSFSYDWSHLPGNTDPEDPTGLCHNNPSSYSVTVTDANGCTQALNNLVVGLAMTVIVEEVENITCQDECDGTIDISIMGGAAPYMYNWSNNAAVQDPGALCAGTYDVTVTDTNGMTAVQTGIVVSEPGTALTVTLQSATNPTGSNNNGSINVNVTGGWGGNTYTWTGPNGFTAGTQDLAGIAAGTYVLVVEDENGCVASIDVQLESLGLALTFDLVPPSCNGDEDGIIEVIVSGGSGDFSYLWSNGETEPIIENLGAGSYTVTVIDNVIGSLNASETVSLTQPNPIFINVISTPVTSDNDGTLEADVTGGTAPYEYIWSTGDSTAIIGGLEPGDYGLQVFDVNGCSEFVSGITVEEENRYPGLECFTPKEIMTPNGDGENEFFYIHCAETVDNVILIFNRWGQMVYEAENYDNSWNGIDQDGELLPEGGYFFVFEYEQGGETIQLKGSITLLR